MRRLSRYLLVCIVIMTIYKEMQKNYETGLALSLFLVSGNEPLRGHIKTNLVEIDTVRFNVSPNTLQVILGTGFTGQMA